MKDGAKLFLCVAIFSFAFVFILGNWGYNFLVEKYENTLSNNEIQSSGEPNSVVTNPRRPKPNKSEPQVSDFEVLNMNGEKVRLSDFFGRPIVINFWASWCGPCVSELPHFLEAYHKYSGDVEFLMVNLTDGYADTVESVKEFVKDNSYDFPIYFDTEYNAAQTYHVDSIPETVFVYADGSMHTRYVGAISSSILEEEISEIFP